MSSNVLMAKNAMFIGQCLVNDLKNAAKVQVRLMEFNSFLKMYFPKEVNFYAHDPEKFCKNGDIVLIKKRPEKLTPLITCDLIKVLYEFGNITDPITQKKCVGNIYRDTLKLEKEVYGVAEDGTGGFDYDSARPRGWQENEKDFSHREGYKQFHDFNPDHPMYNDPAAW